MRYDLVTGVQTCALPSSWVPKKLARRRMASAGAMLLDRLGPPERAAAAGRTMERDRKSVVSGKSVGLGGRRIIKKKNQCADEGADGPARGRPVRRGRSST